MARVLRELKPIAYEKWLEEPWLSGEGKHGRQESYLQVGIHVEDVLLLWHKSWGNGKKPTWTLVSAQCKQDPAFQNSAWAIGLPKNAVNLRRVGKLLGKNVVERFLRLVYLQGTSPEIVTFYKNVKLWLFL